METKGLFDLTAFESAGAGEEVETNILDMPITESEAEFDTKSPASPTEHIDPDCSGEKDVAKKPAETPTAKPADGEMGPVNANSQPEAPTAKPYDANSISVPSGVTMTASEYNDALKRLQQSFKEAAEITELLQHITVIEEATATEEEQAAMKLMTEMAETKPVQFNEWVCSTTGCIFDTLKKAAEKKEIDIEKEKAWKAALKDTEVIAEKLDDLAKQVQELGSKAGKDVKGKVDRVKAMFTKVVCADCEKKDK